MIPSSDATIEDGHGNVIARVIDNGDGTGTRVAYDIYGNVESVEDLTGLPVAAPVVDPAAPFAAAREAVSKATTIAALRTATLALDDLRAKYPTT